MKIRKITFFVIIFLSMNSMFAQNSRFYNNIGIEVGVGHNQLNWSKYNNIKTCGGLNINRNSFYMTPTIRSYYRINICKPLYIQPFVGYHKFGGKSSDDKYTFNAFEFGMLLQNRLSSISYGLGFKINKIFNVNYRSSRYEEDRPDWFKNCSKNIGFRVSYLINKISISAESWFGLEDLSIGPVEGTKIYENHFRLLLGYSFL
ncbi:hypothetical protein HNV12_21030 [Methanococcoides sp. SA1]|nr:hypothetical protein [Methanococcoides sp. SA1]